MYEFRLKHCVRLKKSLNIIVACNRGRKESLTKASANRHGGRLLLKNWGLKLPLNKRLGLKEKKGGLITLSAYRELQKNSMQNLLRPLMGTRATNQRSNSQESERAVSEVEGFSNPPEQKNPSELSNTQPGLS